MSKKINNENEIEMSKLKVGQQQSLTVKEPYINSLSQSKKELSVNFRQHLADKSNHYEISTINANKILKSINTTNPLNALSFKKKPLGGDHAPLHQKQSLKINNTFINTNTSIISTKHILSYKNKNDLLNSNEKKNNVLNFKPDLISSIQDPTSDFDKLLFTKGDYLKLPQKRQATESSTNLVEQIHFQNTTIKPENNNDSSLYKKTKIYENDWDDLDEEDHDDPLMVSEYGNDIFVHLYNLEEQTLPDSNYLHNQKHLNPKMRSFLIDWLIEMHMKFKLLPESLYLAINLMDRFMSREVVQVDKLQLLASSSLFIAAKYEEVFSPSVKNYAYFTSGSFTESDILQAEKYILSVLNFDLNFPNPMNFLRRISKADNYDIRSRTIGKHLLEITVIDSKFIGYKLSLCCASAMYLARFVLGKKPIWNNNLIHYSGGYTVADMKICIENIFQFLISPIEHDGFFEKYSSKKFMKVSIICRNWAKKVQLENRSLF